LVNPAQAAAYLLFNIPATYNLIYNAHITHIDKGTLVYPGLYPRHASWSAGPTDRLRPRGRIAPQAAGPAHPWAACWPDAYKPIAGQAFRARSQSERRFGPRARTTRPRLD
jgi:hypothetical protein